jgi:hypothetical protein
MLIAWGFKGYLIIGVNVLLFYVFVCVCVYFKYEKTLVLMLCAHYKFFVYSSLDSYDNKLQSIQDFFLNQLSATGTMQLLYFQLVLPSQNYMQDFHSDSFGIN